MYTIRKIIFFVSIFWFSLPSLNAQTPAERYGFSLTPLSGILFGQSEEIVYKYSGKDQYLSQLLWDLKPLVYLGFAVDFGPRDPFARNGFIATGTAKFGLPLKTGIIEDRDWMNMAHLGDSAYDYLTHYSHHDAYSQNAILADISAGYSWRLKDFLALSASGQFSFMHFSWVAEDGYTQYASDPGGKDYFPWGNDIPKERVYGPGLLYNQNWFIFAPVISLKGRINNLFSLEGNFSYSPLIYCFDRDDHLLTQTIYWDYLSFGHYINGGGKFIFSPNQMLDLSLAVSYRYITGPRGATDIEYTTTGQDYPIGEAVRITNDGAGVGYSVLDVELALRIRIGN